MRALTLTRADYQTLLIPQMMSAHNTRLSPMNRASPIALPRVSIHTLPDKGIGRQMHGVAGLCRIGVIYSGQPGRIPPAGMKIATATAGGGTFPCTGIFAMLVGPSGFEPETY